MSLSVSEIPLFPGPTIIWLELSADDKFQVTTPLAHVAIVAFPFMTLIANVLARYELSAAKKAWVPQPAIHELRVKLERWTHLKNQGKLGCAVASPASNFNKSQELGKEAELSEVAARKMKGNGKTKGKGKGKKVVLWTIGAGT